MADKKELMLGAWEGCGNRAFQVGETASAKALRLYHTQCLSNSKELSVAKASLAGGGGTGSEGRDHGGPVGPSK